MFIKLKSKFFILLVISSLALSLGLFSTSYAYTFDNFVDYCQQAVNGTVPVNNNTKTACTWFLGNVNNIRSATNVNNYSNFVLSYKDNTYFTMCGGCHLATVTSSSNNFTLNNIVQPLWSCRLFSSSFDTSFGNNPMNSFTTDINFTIGLVNSYYTGNYNRGYLNMYTPPPSIYFTPNHDHIVTQNNIDYNTLLRGYSVNQWKIGETTNFSDLDAFQFYFYDLVANVELGYVEGYREADILRGKNCLYFSPPNMYVNSRYIRYNNPYRLDIHKFLDGVETTESYYFLFLPRNAVVNNGVIVNYGSGDFSVQDSTNAIIDSQESGDKQIIEALTDDSKVDSILSGEFIASSSGDIKNYAEKFGFTVLDNPFTTFLLHLLDETFDALTEPSNVILQADYKGLHFELNSDDFITPSSPLKDFVRNLLIFLYIYGNYRFFNHLIVLIQTAKIDKAIATLGTDEFYDSDIM